MSEENVVGREVARLRQERGWSASKLADLAGLGMQHIYMLESGERGNPTYETIRAVAGALGIEPAELLMPGEGPLPAELEAFLSSPAGATATAPEVIRLRRAKIVLGREPSALDYAAFLSLLRRP